jgi:hypothetical protein
MGRGHAQSEKGPNDGREIAALEIAHTVQTCLGFSKALQAHRLQWLTGNAIRDNQIDLAWVIQLGRHR